MIGPKRVASTGHAQLQRRAGSRPAAQIAPTSSVGIALSEIAIKHRETYRDHDDSGGSSPSDSSDSDGDYSSTVSDEETKKTQIQKAWTMYLVHNHQTYSS